VRDNLLKRLTVLIVEDDEQIGLALQQFLQKKCENVYLTRDGQEGYEAFEAKPIDVIITDITMPRLNGLEMAQLIRASNADIPIIISTAYVHEHFMLEAIELNITHYHRKPLNMKLLLMQLATIAKNLYYKQLLDEKNRLVQHVIDFQSNMIAVFKNQKIRFCNKSFLEFFNIDSLEMLQDCHELLFGVEIVTHEKTNLQTLVRRSKHSNLNEKVQIKDLRGNARTFQMYSTYLPLEDEIILSLSDISQLEEKHRLMEEMATVDFLTQVNNRMKFLTLLEMVYKSAKRYHHPLCVAMFDIDFFKRVNDGYGHNVGDKVLREFAQVILQNIRKSDQFARWGGEEFILFLSHTDKQKALLSVEKLRKAIEEKCFSHDLKITCSIGISCLNEEDSAYEQIINRADEALYLAKAAGRNCIMAV